MKQFTDSTCNKVSGLVIMPTVLPGDSVRMESKCRWKIWQLSRVNAPTPCQETEQTALKEQYNQKWRFLWLSTYLYVIWNTSECRYNTQQVSFSLPPNSWGEWRRFLCSSEEGKNDHKVTSNSKELSLLAGTGFSCLILRDSLPTNQMNVHWSLTYYAISNNHDHEILISELVIIQPTVNATPNYLQSKLTRSKEPFWALERQSLPRVRC